MTEWTQLQIWRALLHYTVTASGRLGPSLDHCVLDLCKTRVAELEAAEKEAPAPATSPTAPPTYGEFEVLCRQVERLEVAVDEALDERREHGKKFAHHKHRHGDSGECYIP